MIIQAPFNFVPLSDKVYLPDWADKISQDIPFSDGLSGKIRLSIEAKTPIFVRNGQTKTARDNSFSNVSGRCFLPASSIKGEVRNLLEIMSFGKMSLETRAKSAPKERDTQTHAPLKSKQPDAHSPQELLPQQHKASALDLAECIFGYTDNDTGLKGRVQFSNAFSGNAQEEDETALVLGGPKASYYPIYIEQEGRGGVTRKYKTYNDGKLSGWKRYHPREQVWNKYTGNPKIDSYLRPVKAGAVFEGEIVFHNLRPIELGALLSALTFHNTPNCYHLLGQAKPYGYGRCLYKSNLICAETNHDARYFMGCFEHELNKLVGKWHQTPQITELFAIAANPVDRGFRYMEMKTARTPNQFLAAKKNREYLRRFTQINPAATTVQPQSLTKDREEEEKSRRLEQIKELWESELDAIHNAPLEAALPKLEEALNRLRQEYNTTVDADKRSLLDSLQERFQAQKERFQAKKEELQKEQQAQQAARDKEALYNGGLSALLNPAKSLNANIGGILKWMKTIATEENRATLHPEEITAVANTFLQIYNKANKRDKKNWDSGRVAQQVEKELGSVLSQKIFALFPQ